MQSRLGLLLVGALFFGFALPANACDPLGCALSGHDQDILAVVTVTAHDGETAAVMPEQYLEPSRIRPDGPIDIVPVRRIEPAPPLVFQGSVGESYLISLSCDDESHCYQHWGSRHVTGNNEDGWKLVEIDDADDAAMQWYLSGRRDDFFGISDRMYVRTDSGETFQIYPFVARVESGNEVAAWNDHLVSTYAPMLAGSMILFAGTLLFFLRRRYR